MSPEQRSLYAAKIWQLQMSNEAGRDFIAAFVEWEENLLWPLRGDAANGLRA
jgi:hypothetical protein